MGFRALSLACVGVSILVGSIVACGGDDETSGGGPSGPDSGTPDNVVGPTPTDGGGVADATPPLPSGALDPTFGVGGLSVLNSSDPSSETPNVVLRQPDGKLVIAGAQSETGGAFVVRLTAAGALDATFGTGGRLVVGSNYGRSGALQADGKIVVGMFGNVLRLNTDGTIDTTFGDQGFANIDDMTPNAITILGDGKLAIAGVRPNRSIGFTVARLTSAGVKDPTFDGDGYAQDTAFSDGAHSIAVDAQGRFVVSGEIFSNAKVPVARINPDGTLDGSFGTGGQVTVTTPGTAAHSRVAIQNDGNIVVAGKSGASCATFRLSGVDGAIDTAFGATDGGADGGAQNGIVLGPSCGGVGPVGVALRADGKIVVAKPDGWFQLGADGVLDAAFGTSGVTLLNSGTPKLPTTGSQSAFMLLPDGTIAGTGTINHSNGTSGSMWKGTAAGMLDTTFATAGQTTFPFFATRDEVRRMDVLADDSILFAGDGVKGIVVARFTASGALDTTFGTAGFTPLQAGQVSGIARDASGRIIVSGESSIFALSPQGVPEAAFNGANGMTVQSPNASEWFASAALAIDQNGRAIVAGLGGGGGTSNILVARVTAAGVQDTTFGTANGIPARTAYRYAGATPQAVSVLADGKILVAGNADTGDGLLLRLDGAGALDASFGVKTYPNLYLRSMIVQADGKVLLVGGSTIVRVDANGTLDPTFGTAGISNALEPTGLGAEGARVLPDGRIVVVGNKNDNDGRTTIGMARLSATGSLELSVIPTLALETRAHDLVLQKNGAVVAGGYATSAVTDRDYALARFAP